VLHVAIKSAEERELLRWPLLLHVVFDLGAEEGIPILVRNHDGVTVVMLQGHLDRDPLVVWNEEGLGDRLVVVFTSEEEESSCVATH
jgi:hypothetical protein